MKDFQEQDCRITFKGRTYTSGGAYISGDHALVYIAGKQAQTWTGAHIGTVKVVSSWKQYPPRARFPVPYTMTSVRVTMTDGSVWTGRYNSDWSQACKLRRASK